VAAIAFVWPILPGRQEAWRRFCQVLMGSRLSEYEESRQRLGIRKELAWLHHFTQALQGEIVVVYLEAEHPERVVAQLAASDLPFDCWFRKQLLELHGLDLAQPPSGPTTELVFVWQTP
jgi:hypothetical protein